VPSPRAVEILARLLDGSTPVDDLAHELVTRCAAALPVTGVGLVLMTKAGPAGTVAVSDGPAHVLEELQFALGEGPSIECSRTGRPVLQPDLARTGPLRWPGFCAGALEAGVRAIFAFPLRVGGIRLGVLGLYRDAPGELSQADQVEALSFADAATALLLHLHAQSPPDAQAAPSETAGVGPADPFAPKLGAITVLEDRAEIHQATGVVAVQASATIAEALVLLRARAYALDRSILELSRDVLEGNVSFTDAYDDDAGTAG
jgi:GAF domain-containing protein